jgi:hypothetical protein
MKNNEKQINFDGYLIICDEIHLIFDCILRESGYFNELNEVNFNFPSHFQLAFGGSNRKEGFLENQLFSNRNDISCWIKFFLIRTKVQCEPFNSSYIGNI